MPIGQGGKECCESSAQVMVNRMHQQKKRQGQRTDLQRLLQYVWERSAFYRGYYQSQGIREKDLDDLTVRDLPILSKRNLMENFDTAVTDSRLNKASVEQWLHDNPDPRLRFARDFVVVHSSGSSGNIAIFVYDEKSWRIPDFAMAGRLLVPQNYPSERIKIAFYMATHGHFAMVSIAASMQKPYETLLLSLLDSRESVVKQLNAFKPHRLYGYSSSITELAKLALEGRLNIQPASILVAGDKLTPAMESTIRRAWPATIHVTYGSSESKYIAVREAGDE